MIIYLTLLCEWMAKLGNYANNLEKQEFVANSDRSNPKWIQQQHILAVLYLCSVISIPALSLFCLVFNDFNPRKAIILKKSNGLTESQKVI